MRDQYLYSKSSGNTFRSIQILPLFGGQFEKQKNSRNHSCACHWEKKRLIRWLFCSKTKTKHSFEEDAGAFQTFCTILLPQLRGPTQHTLKRNIFPYRTTHPKSARGCFWRKFFHVQCPINLSEIDWFWWYFYLNSWRYYDALTLLNH